MTTDEDRQLREELVKTLNVPIDLLIRARIEVVEGDYESSAFHAATAARLLAELFDIGNSDTVDDPRQSREQAVTNAVEYGRGLLDGLKRTLERL